MPICKKLAVEHIFTYGSRPRELPRLTKERARRGGYGGTETLQSAHANNHGATRRGGRGSQSTSYGSRQPFTCTVVVGRLIAHSLVAAAAAVSGPISVVNRECQSGEYIDKSSSDLLQRYTSTSSSRRWSRRLRMNMWARSLGLNRVGVVLCMLGYVWRGVESGFNKHRKSLNKDS